MGKYRSVKILLLSLIAVNIPLLLSNNAEGYRLAITIGIDVILLTLLFIQLLSNKQSN